MKSARQDKDTETGNLLFFLGFGYSRVLRAFKGYAEPQFFLTLNNTTVTDTLTYMHVYIHTITITNFDSNHLCL